MSAAYIQVHFREDFFMQANNMKPDHTGFMFILQYRLPKNKQTRGADDKNVYRFFFLLQVHIKS